MTEPASGRRRRVGVVPPVPALLPEHASLADPVSELRSACREAVALLVPEATERVVVLSDSDDPWADRVATALLAQVGHRGEVASGPPDAADAVLVMANGSARRGGQSPGGADDRAIEFDDRVEKALVCCDGAALQSLDAGLGTDLLASGTRSLREVGRLLEHGTWSARLLYSGDPFGVQYWVAVLACGPRSPAPVRT